MSTVYSWVRKHLGQYSLKRHTGKSKMYNIQSMSRSMWQHRGARQQGWSVWVQAVRS
jgi:hypothetical protein